MSPADQEFEALRPGLCRWITRRYARPDRDELEDVIAEGCLGALLRLRACDHPSRFGVALWGARTAIRRFLAHEIAERCADPNRHHPTRREKVVFRESELWERNEGRTEDPASGVIDRLSAGELARQTLATATPRERTVLEAVYWRGLTPMAAAAALKLSQSVIDHSLATALNRTRSCLGVPLRGWSDEARREYQRRLCRKRRQGKVNPCAPNAGKSHCTHGHPYAGHNLRIDRLGRWRCRACANEGARRERERRRALKEGKPKPSAEEKQHP